MFFLIIKMADFLVVVFLFFSPHSNTWTINKRDEAFLFLEEKRVCVFATHVCASAKLGRDGALTSTPFDGPLRIFISHLVVASGAQQTIREHQAADDRGCDWFREHSWLLQEKVGVRDQNMENNKGRHNRIFVTLSLKRIDFNMFPMYY